MARAVMHTQAQACACVAAAAAAVQRAVVRPVARATENENGVWAALLLLPASANIFNIHDYPTVSNSAFAFAFGRLHAHPLDPRPHRFALLSRHKTLPSANSGFVTCSLLLFCGVVVVIVQLAGISTPTALATLIEPLRRVVVLNSCRAWCGSHAPPPPPAADVYRGAPRRCARRPWRRRGGRVHRLRVHRRHILPQLEAVLPIQLPLQAHDVVVARAALEAAGFHRVGR